MPKSKSLFPRAVVVLSLALCAFFSVVAGIGWLRGLPEFRIFLLAAAISLAVAKGADLTGVLVSYLSAMIIGAAKGLAEQGKQTALPNPKPYPRAATDTGKSA
jgi:hypothetical protein